MSQARLPAILNEYLTDIHIRSLSPAWLRVQGDSGCIVEYGGDWSLYSDTVPVEQTEILSLLPCLYGQVFGDDFVLPHMELREGCYTDIHNIPDKDSQAGGSWLLLLDVTDPARSQLARQQHANELSLLGERQRRLLDRYMGSEVADLSLEGKLAFDVEGERRRITTMFVDLRSFTVFNQVNDPQEVLDVLNQYMDRMIKPVLAEFGLIDKIVGDGAMALFGVLPCEDDSAVHALRVAIEIQRGIELLNRQRIRNHEAVMKAGIGIASGEAVMGIVGTRERRSFTVIGPHVNLAARIEKQAKGAELLVDAETFRRIIHLVESFGCSAIELKGIGQTGVFNINY